MAIRRILIALLTLPIACGLPVTTFEAYRSKATDAVDDVISQARTAILTARLAGRDRLVSSAAAVQLEDAETAATAAVEGFASLLPPNAPADRLRARILPVLEATSDVIARMRFEASREGTPALLALRADLEEPTRLLERWLASGR